jgi:hypothetical protein
MAATPDIGLGRYGLYLWADPMEIKFEVVAHTRTPLIIAEK